MQRIYSSQRESLPPICKLCVCECAFASLRAAVCCRSIGSAGFPAIGSPRLHTSRNWQVPHFRKHCFGPRWLRVCSHAVTPCHVVTRICVYVSCSSLRCTVRACLQRLLDFMEDTPFTPAVADDIASLWADPGVREAYEYQSQ